MAANSGTPGDTTTVQGNLENLPSIGVGNVSVTGPAGGPYIITFQGALCTELENATPQNPIKLEFRIVEGI